MRTVQNIGRRSPSAAWPRWRQARRLELQKNEGAIGGRPATATPGAARGALIWASASRLGREGRIAALRGPARSVNAGSDATTKTGRANVRQTRNHAHTRGGAETSARVARPTLAKNGGRGASTTFPTIFKSIARARAYTLPVAATNWDQHDVFRAPRFKLDGVRARDTGDSSFRNQTAKKFTQKGRPVGSGESADASRTRRTPVEPAVTTTAVRFVINR